MTALPQLCMAETQNVPPRRPVQYQLLNRLQVIIRPIAGAKQTALVVLYSVGHDHDPEGRSGLGHMLEHVYLTAAAGSERSRSVEEFMRRYPEGSNGQTGARYTVLATVFPEKDLDRELRDAAGRMGALRVTAADLDRERPRLLEEVENMYGRIPPLGALNNARDLVRPTPAGGRVGGASAHVNAITAEELQARSDRYYKPRNAILALAGALDADAANAAIRAYFAKIPPGDPVPAPGRLGAPKFGTVREVAVESRIPDARTAVCLAYAAPQPDSDLYAPFLVLVSRLLAVGERFGGDARWPPVFFPPLDGPEVVGVSAPAKPGETGTEAVKRIESVVAEALAPALDERELRSVREQFGLVFGLDGMPDELLAQNPYGVAFSLGRRAQLGLDAARLERAVEGVKDTDLRRAAEAIFAPRRHAGSVVTPKGR
jgi:zinc protease